MKLAELKSSGLAAVSASVASLCCLLPLAVVVLGLGSGAFMAVTMKYTYVFLPIGILGTAAGSYLHFRERRRCERLGCAMAGGRLNLALLVASTLVLATAVALTAMPETTSRLIAAWSGTQAMDHGAPGPAASHPAGPSSESGPEAVPARLARATLHVDGMT